MSCYRCGSDTGESLGLCSECRKTIEKSMSAGIPRNQSSLPRIRGGAARFLAFTIIALAVFFIIRDRVALKTLEPFVVYDYQGYASKPCASANACIYAYLTPWCPHCTRSAPLLKELEKFVSNKPDLGLAVIVGGDSYEAIRSFCQSNRLPQCYYDDKASFHSSAKISSVPRWIATRMDGNVTGSMGGSISGAALSDQVDFILNKLGLSSYVIKR